MKWRFWRRFFRIVNVIRLLVLYTVGREYIKLKLKTRNGGCLKCGVCCTNCSFLDKETKLCKIYNSRPSWCHKDFPVDEWDKKLGGVKDICGYYWD